MLKKMMPLCTALLLLSSCGEQREKGCCCYQQKEEIYTPLVVSLFEASPPVLGSDGQYHLLYALKLTNASSLPATIKTIEVVDARNDSVVKSFEGEEILSGLVHLSSAGAESPEIERDGSRIFFVKLQFGDRESIPGMLAHRFSLDGAAGPGSENPEALNYEAGSFCVCLNKPPVLSPPLRGGGWVVFNGCCSSGGVHQNSLLPVNGRLYNSQRFAIDFMKLDEQGRLVEGDQAEPSNWFCYGESVYAVGEGIVVSVLDGLPDQPPGDLPDPESITLQTVTGNHVIIKLKDSAYAFYAHLRNGSIKVAVGDRVSVGQEIASIGNSGNTSAPHLHLHLTNTPSPIGSAPVPYTYDSFTLVGIVDQESFYESDDMGKRFGNEAEFTPEKHFDQLPLDLTILDFKG